MLGPRTTTVTEYIASCPKNVQGMLRQLRSAIRSVAPQAVEKISYGMPYYAYKGRLVYFAAAKKHIGVYALFPDPKTSPLRKYIAGKGTLRFPLDQKIPVSLIKQQIKIRMKANETKKKK